MGSSCSRSIVPFRKAQVDHICFLTVCIAFVGLLCGCATRSVVLPLSEQYRQQRMGDVTVQYPASGVECPCGRLSWILGNKVGPNTGAASLGTVVFAKTMWHPAILVCCAKKEAVLA
jgi:hypothetical protein